MKLLKIKKLLKNVPKIIKCSIISSKNVLKFCPNQRSISDGPKLGRHVGNRSNGEVGEIVAPTSRSFQLHKVPPNPPVRVYKAKLCYRFCLSWRDNYLEYTGLAIRLGWV